MSVGLRIHSFGIQDKPSYAQALEIRHRVFVEEQGVPEFEEVDAYEKESVHYLVRYGLDWVGAGRWRPTHTGIKMERIAILASHRRRGIATQLLQQMLADIHRTHGKKIGIYLHAQQDACALYEAVGFRVVGKPFSECAIWHLKMTYTA